MEISEILSIVTFFITLICGVISKKHPKINNKIIPIQNILIGVVMAIIDYIITKDFTTAIAVSGLVAGGAYDVINNLNKLKGDE
jgi:uncharacterized membrane protein YeaQ/YmgE (transglycosylase-associated protein family)